MSIAPILVPRVCDFSTQIRSVLTAADGTLLLEPEPGYNQTDYSLMMMIMIWLASGHASG